MTQKEAHEIVSKAAAGLGEHFDHVLILTTWDESGESRSVQCSEGNLFARRGLARAFLDNDAAEASANKIADAIKPPEDEV